MVSVSLLRFHETPETKPDQVLFKRKPVQYVAKAPILEDQEVKPNNGPAVLIKTLICSRYGQLKPPMRSSPTTRTICNGKPEVLARPGYMSDRGLIPLGWISINKFVSRAFILLVFLPFGLIEFLETIHL